MKSINNAETERVEALIPRDMKLRLDEAVERQGITLDEAISEMVENYLRLYDEVVCDPGKMDPAVQDLMKAMLPDGRIEKQGHVFHLPLSTEDENRPKSQP